MLDITNNVNIIEGKKAFCQGQKEKSECRNPLLAAYQKENGRKGMRHEGFPLEAQSSAGWFVAVSLVW